MSETTTPAARWLDELLDGVLDEGGAANLAALTLGAIDDGAWRLDLDAVARDLGVDRESLGLVAYGALLMARQALPLVGADGEVTP